MKSLGEIFMKIFCGFMSSFALILGSGPGYLARKARGPTKNVSQGLQSKFQKGVRT